jgi:hypothetical protein
MRSIFNIALITDKMNLNEVVITGYTTQQKKDITGAVGIVDLKTMKSIPAQGRPCRHFRDRLRVLT